MGPKIAVVVPVYNAERFLSNCLDSILNQDFKDIKVICVNDASKDNCSSILEEYAKRDERLVVLNHDVNKGAGAARNTGLDYIFENLPSVEYISLIDADDKIEPNTYTKTYEEAKKSDADIVNYNFLPSTYWEYKTEANTEPVDYNGNCIEAIFDYKEFYTFVLCWSKLYRKELLENIRFSDQKFFEDGSFAYKVLPRAKKMRIIPDTLYYYNIENPESTCGKVDETNRLKSIFNTIKETVRDWKKLGIYDKYKYEYIKHILLYTSMVCPNAFVGNYTDDLNESLEVDILSSEVSDKVSDETKGYIEKMTSSGIELSEEYKTNIKNMFGEIGEKWLEDVPNKIAKYAKELKLKNLRLVGDLTYNILCFAESEEYGEVVFKIEIPFKEMTIREANALKINNGKGSCRCYYSNVDDGVILLERLRPGTNLNIVSDLEERVKVFFDVSNKFNIKTDTTVLPTYREILDRSINIAKSNRKFDCISDLITKMDQMYREMENDYSGELDYLLHSDLYSDNIIQSNGEWKTIDPHGFTGPKIIDCTIFIQKELEARSFDDSNIEHIINLMAEYSDFGSGELCKALFINYVLNLCWDIEVNFDDNHINNCTNNANRILDYYNKNYKQSVKTLSEKTDQN